VSAHCTATFDPLVSFDVRRHGHSHKLYHWVIVGVHYWGRVMVNHRFGYGAWVLKRLSMGTWDLATPMQLYGVWTAEC